MQYLLYEKYAPSYLGVLTNTWLYRARISMMMKRLTDHEKRHVVKERQKGTIESNVAQSVSVTPPQVCT